MRPWRLSALTTSLPSPPPYSHGGSSWSCSLLDVREPSHVRSLPTSGNAGTQPLTVMSMRICVHLFSATGASHVARECHLRPGGGVRAGWLSQSSPAGVASNAASEQGMVGSASPPLTAVTALSFSSRCVHVSPSALLAGGSGADSPIVLGLTLSSSLPLFSSRRSRRRGTPPRPSLAAVAAAGGGAGVMTSGVGPRGASAGRGTG